MLQTTGKKSLADLIRSREADEEQAKLIKEFLAWPPRSFLWAEKVFGKLKIEKVRRVT